MGIVKRAVNHSAAVAAGFSVVTLGGVWGATGQAAPHNPPADSHGVCGWPWGEGGRFAWRAASGAVRAEVWPARRRNGAALAEATVKHGFFATPSNEALNDKQAGRWRCLPPRLLLGEGALARGALAKCARPWQQGRAPE